MLTSYKKLLVVGLILAGLTGVSQADDYANLAPLYPFTEDTPLVIALQPEEDTELGESLQNYFDQVAAEIKADYYGDLPPSNSASRSSLLNRNKPKPKRSKPTLSVNFSNRRLEVRLMERRFAGQRPGFRAAIYVGYSVSAGYSKEKKTRGVKRTVRTSVLRADELDLLFFTNINSLTEVPGTGGEGATLTASIEIPTTPAANITPGAVYDYNERVYGQTSEVGLRAAKLQQYLYGPAADPDRYKVDGEPENTFDPTYEYESRFASLDIVLDRQSSLYRWDWVLESVELMPVEEEQSSVAVNASISAVPETFLPFNHAEGGYHWQLAMPFAIGGLEPSNWLAEQLSPSSNGIGHSSTILGLIFNEESGATELNVVAHSHAADGSHNDVELKLPVKVGSFQKAVQQGVVVDDSAFGEDGTFNIEGLTIVWPEGFDADSARQINAHQALVFVAEVPSEQGDNEVLTTLQEANVKQIQGFLTRSGHILGNVVIKASGDDEELGKHTFTGNISSFHYPWAKDPAKNSFGGFGGP
jgi:hypothetical protein